jgi:hypothetical protein
MSAGHVHGSGGQRRRDRAGLGSLCGGHTDRARSHKAGHDRAGDQDLGAEAEAERKAFRKGVRFRVTPSEPARLSIRLLGSKRSKRPRYTVRLSSKSFALGRERKLTLKPKRSRMSRAPKFTVRLQIVATDAAGNRRTVRRTLKVSR